MKYKIKVRSTADPHLATWPYYVADSKYEGVLTIQEPHPDAGDNLLGFENEPQTCELLVRVDPDWTEKCIGMSPVFATTADIYSVPTLQVEEVVKLE